MPTHPETEQELHTAHSLEDAANADNSLQGYAAINDVEDQHLLAQGHEAHNTHGGHHSHHHQHAEIERLAYQFYQERGGQNGSADDDWFRAEREVHARS